MIRPFFRWFVIASEAKQSSFFWLWIARAIGIPACSVHGNVPLTLPLQGRLRTRIAPRKKRELGKAAATIKTVVARLDRAIQYAAASHLSQTSLEYWVARSSRAMTVVFVSFIRVGSKVGTEPAMTRLRYAAASFFGGKRP
jgi:hypothetical protein